MIPRMSIVLLGLVALFTFATTSTRAQSVLTHHVREVIHTAEAQSTGHMAADQVMHLNIVLKLRDQAGLDAFLKDLYDPTSVNYRHFLTVAESVPQTPMLLYAFPGNAKNDISPALLGRLLKAAPNIVGIKSSNDDRTYTS